MSYGTNFNDAIYAAAVYAGRIISGEKPGDLPIIRSVRFELVINSTTSKALKIDIPSKLLALADEVIE